MDLYGADGNAVAMGNARRQEVRDLNERIKAHNQDIADKINTYDTLIEGLELREVDEEDLQKRIRKFTRSLDEICFSLTGHNKKK